MFNCMDQNSFSITSPHKILVENQDNLLLPIFKYLNPYHLKQANLVCKCWKDAIQEMEITQKICQKLKHILFYYQPKKQKQQRAKATIEKIDSIHVEDLATGILSLNIIERNIPYYYRLHKKSLKQFKHILHIKDAFYSLTIKKIAEEIAFFHFPFQIILNFGPGTESFREKILDRYKNQTDQFKTFIKEFQIVNIFKNAKGGCIISASRTDKMKPVDVQLACVTTLSEYNAILNRAIFNEFDQSIVFVANHDANQITNMRCDQTLANQLSQRLCDPATEMKNFIDSLPPTQLPLYKKFILPRILSNKFFEIWPEENANPDPNQNKANLFLKIV